jgi:hypothetical protein
VLSRFVPVRVVVVVLLAVLFAGTSAEAAPIGAWRVEFSPTPGRGSVFLGAVSSGGRSWAVGRVLTGAAGCGCGGWRPLIARRSGAGWERVRGARLGPYKVARAELRGIAADGRRDLWAVGILLSQNAANQGLLEHWDGTRWHHYSSLGTNQLRAVAHVPGTDTFWAVGGYSQGTTSLFFDGTSWSRMLTPNHKPAGPLTGVAAFGPDDVWAVGSTSVPGVRAHGVPFSMRWAGSAWSLVHMPTRFLARDDSPAIVAVTRAPAKHQLWAVGYNDKGDRMRRGTLVYHYLHGSWHHVRSPNPRQFNALYGVIAPRGGGVYAYGYTKNRGDRYPHALILHRTGRHWTVIPLPDLAAKGALYAGAFSTKRLFAVGGTTFESAVKGLETRVISRKRSP